MQTVSRFLRYVWGRWWALSRALWKRKTWGKGCAVMLWFVAFSVACYSITAFGMALGVIPNTAATQTAEWNATQTQVAILALTPSATSTPSYTPTATLTPTDTLTPTMTYTPSHTPTPSKTFTPSNTPTASPTPTDTWTPTHTFTPTQTPTRTPTFTPSATGTPRLDDEVAADIAGLWAIEAVFGSFVNETADGWMVSVDVRARSSADFDVAADKMWDTVSARLGTPKDVQFIIWAMGREAVSYNWNAAIDDGDGVHQPGEWQRTVLSTTPEPTFTPTHTPTLPPTAADTATSTPTRDAGVSTRRYITGASVNLRACAGTTGCAVVGQMEYGDDFTPWGVDTDTQGRAWYMFLRGGEFVYVAGWLTSDRRPPTPAPYVAPPSGGSGSGSGSGQAPPPPPTSSGWACDCSKTCSVISSCEEAYFQLQQCGCTKRDKDGDGVPCENLCPGGN